MAGGTDRHGGADPCPVDIAFGGEVPEDCLPSGNTVICSPADHHADLLSVETAVAICRECPEREVRAGGMFDAQQVVRSVYQLGAEYGDDIRTGVYAQVTTPDHDQYPQTVIHGFSAVAGDGFSFPRIVRSNLRETFEDADVRHVTGRHVTVITSDHPFQRGAIEVFLDTIEEAL